MKKVFGFGVAATMVMGGTASADILYDNPPDFKTTAHVDQEFGDFPTYSTYLVADFTVPAGPGFFLTSVTSYMSINKLWPGVTTARLVLFPKVGPLPLPGDDPAAALIVPVLYDVNTGFLSTVGLAGLNVEVGPGEYWIGLTGIGDFLVVGQAFHFGGVNQVNGDPDAYRNPGGDFNFPDGTGWGAMQQWATYTEIALTVEGDLIPAPGALALLGVAGLVTRRRRRR